jgi:Glycosyl hydrolases family 2/Glycosyl hydrolases family 2, sugar binding domain
MNRRKFLQISGLGSMAAAADVELKSRPVRSGLRWEQKLDGTWLFMPEQELGRAVRPQDPALRDEGWPEIDVPNFWRPIYYWLWGEQEKASPNYTRMEMDRVSRYHFDPYATRAGWYRRWIEIPKETQGKRFFVKFWAVAMIAEVWWNGQTIGSHLGMFGPFELEVTRAVRPGANLLSVFVAGGRYAGRGDVDALKSRVITVDVSSAWLDDMPQSVFFMCGKEGGGGIWQSVSLSASDAVRIEDVFFQPRLDGARIDVTLNNGNPQIESRSLRYVISDFHTGAALTQATEGVSIRLLPDESRKFVIELNGLHPKLWMPEEPNLYWLKVELWNGSQKTDEIEQAVGFRTFQVRGTRFYLNDKPYYLRGATQPPYGLKPWDSELAYRYFQLMRQGNELITAFNETGGNDVWCHAADLVGIGIIDQGAWTWALQAETDPPKELIEVWKKTHREMVVSVRNHPCILARSINDEAWFHYMPPRALGFDAEKGGYFDSHRERRLRKWQSVSEVIKLTREIDPTRPIGASGGYSRTRQEWADLEPLRIDDGDFDNVHVFNGTYGPSYLCLNVQRDIEQRYSMGQRPLITDQAGTGYPDNDIGFPCDNYIDIVMTPQAWVGQYVYDQRLSFQDVNGQIIKEGYEKIRRDKSIIGGWLMFSNCQWFRNVYDAKTIRPFPKIYEKACRALEPVLVSLETGNRHFVSGQELSGPIAVVHDDGRKDHLRRVLLQWRWVTNDGKELSRGEKVLPDVGYYEVVRSELQFAVPASLPRPLIRGRLEFKLLSGRDPVSRNEYPIMLAEPSWFRAQTNESFSILVLGEDAGLQAELRRLGIEGSVRARVSWNEVDAQTLVIVTPSDVVSDLQSDRKELLKFVERGGVLLFQDPSPAQAAFLGLRSEPIHLHFKQHIWDTPAGPWGAEYVNLDKHHPLAAGLDPVYDMRWWNTTDVRHPRVSDQVLSSLDGSSAPISIFDAKSTSLCTYVAPHGYYHAPWDFKRLFERAVLVEARLGKGMILVSTVRLAPDPVSWRFFLNLVRYSQYRGEEAERVRYF